MKVLFLDTNHPVLLEGLRKLNLECDEDYSSSKSAIEAKIQDYDGLIIRSRFSLDQSFLEKATKLKFIGRVGAGLENIDNEYALSKGIKLIAAPEGNRNAVGEHALGMILSLFNKFKKADTEIRNGIWLREDNRGIELEGKTIGLIGYGNMGKAFAKKLKGFDCDVICYDIKPDVGDQNARQVSLTELLERTEVLSLHTPQTELTKHMIDESFLNQFQKSIYVINTARGSAIITKDLVQALETGKVLGACLDVLEYEKNSFENFFSKENTLPEDFQYLITSDKVLLSPHVAGWTVESKYKLAETIVHKVAAMLDQHNSIK
ncbi:2-hydroxyacid dehydrogenase [Lutimonas halocynthiae]|uniref:2-hydroxyacid dehydrogenase n=1 Tax=Lutimonas halocynthiae TaxID=1446477 RepID=UPI0025B2CFD3|nr:2-hydroxyacid dehydrogenase [Lutimonas halocynthiae]MDN3641931.1 2-hydroxyacid dehydrogenase [Lutimonas halocynthiae]